MVRTSTKERIKQVAYHRSANPQLWSNRPITPDCPAIILNQESKAKKPELRKILEERLQHQYLIVAGGAWQHLWEKEDTPTVGFHSLAGDAVTTEPSQEDLRSSIKPELLKRFRSDIVVMNAMSKNDYEHVIVEMTTSLPNKYRDLFKKLAYKRINEAVSEKIGMRYFEEILSQTMKQQLLEKHLTPQSKPSINL